MYTNRTGSTLNLNLYSRDTTAYGLKGGSNCVRECSRKCYPHPTPNTLVAAQDDPPPTRPLPCLASPRLASHGIYTRIPGGRLLRDASSRTSSMCWKHAAATSHFCAGWRYARWARCAVTWCTTNAVKWDSSWPPPTTPPTPKPPSAKTADEAEGGKAPGGGGAAVPPDAAAEETSALSSLRNAMVSGYSSLRA